MSAPPKGVLVTDVERLILEAWQKLGKKIMADPQEMAKRLARRRSALLNRPQRAWCLCIRASDRRITPAHWIIYPEHAMDLTHEDHPYHPIKHDVTIDARVLRKYLRPVRTDSWGEFVEDVAKQLGVHPVAMNPSRHKGIFTERSVKGLGGRRGRPVPLIHSWKHLDPSGPMFARPDPLWGSLWEFYPDMIPDDFQQTLIRRPKFSVWGVGRGRSTKAPNDHLYTEDMRFIGWRWLCPGCKKQVRKVYYPLAPQTLFDYLGFDPARSKRCRAQSKKFLPCDVDEMPRPPPTFACADCHKIAYTTRTRDTVWNEVVSWLTRGMLYGHEVEKPQWYKRERKATRSRRLGRPAPKRDAVFTRLRLGWPVEQIAINLRMHISSVRSCLRLICLQEHVKNRHELAARLAWKHPQPQNAFEKRCQLAREKERLVEPLLIEGLLYREIAQRLHCPHHDVETAAMRIYRKLGIAPGEGRKGFKQRFATGQKKDMSVK